MGIELGKSSVREFSDGEIQVNIEESIRGHHVFISSIYKLSCK